MKSINLLKTALAFALFAAPAAHAVTIQQFYTLSPNDRWDFLVDTINQMCRNLRSTTNGKGELKSPELLKKQKDFANFIVDLFDEEDSKGVPVNYAKIRSIIYSARLDNSSASVESLLVAFVTERYQQKLAADAAHGASK